MIKRCSMLNCEIELDEAETRQWYANAEKWGCSCGHCINFLELAQKNVLPDRILKLLSFFGIPPEKATYVCCLTEHHDKLLYQFSYRIAGNILKDNALAAAEDAHFCHETYPYGAPNFPTPHFDLEFFAELPWATGDSME